MPQAVLDSPFGRMLQPQLEQMVQARKAQQGGLLGIQANAQPLANNSSAAAAPSVVRNATSLPELNALLEAARVSAAVVFFTSATCPPCKALYPLYDQLAAEWGHQVTLIKVDTSRAFDVAQQYAIRGTPTFLSFFHGQRQEHWVGADGARLRGTVQLLAQMAHPAHPHLSLRLPHFADPAVAAAAANPTLYAKVPPLPKLLSKLAGVAGIAVDDDPAVQGLKRFIELRAAEGPVDAPLPPDMPAIARGLRSAVADLPRDVLFAAVDLFRCALADARFSGYFAEEPGHATVVAVLDAVNGYAAASDCPYALRLVTLQMACNLFSSPLYAEQVLLAAANALRDPLIRLLTSSFLDEGHSSVRVAAASLLCNIASASASASASAASSSNNNGHNKKLPESDQVELAASVLEAIGQEGESGEALHGMLLGLGFLAYRAPLDGELADLLRVLDAQDTVLAKKGRFPGEPLVEEVGSELLGKGLAKP